LEAKDKIRPESPEQFAMPSASPSSPQCAECLETIAADTSVAGRRGETLCAVCAKNYYVACSACHGLIPQDEALTHNDAVYCFDCEAQALKANAGGEIVPDEAEVESLVSEYIALHGEEKRIKDRLDEIKEQLKAAASVRQRVAGAVTLSGDEGAVKCSFKTSLKCIPERVSALEEQLEPEKFAALFERKVSYSPVKDQLEKFLSNDDGTQANLREVVLAAVERTETPTLTVVRPKK
jgi:Zn finger protein HypA/HybF involved in hydrogenase expression